jgi:SPX domain protein involved in polyphosphate accumulation
MDSGSITDDRIELKLRIDPSQTAQLLAIAAAHLPEHHFDGSRRTQAPTLRHYITTVYLDTPSHALYRAVAADEASLKIRVREYYDVQDPAGVVRQEPSIFVELKNKEFGRTRKRRTALSKARLPSLLEQQVVDDEVTDAVLAELRRVRGVLGEPLGPSCAVNYWRRAFQAPDASLRITIDQDVAFFVADEHILSSAPVLSRSNLGEPVRVEVPHVVEIKHRSSIPAWLQQAVEAVGGDASTFSKFQAGSRAVLDARR